MIRVTIWNEYLHEIENIEIKKIYPRGIHGCLARFLSGHKDLTVKTATLKMAEHGLTDKVLEETDVLIWWGHVAHHLIEDKIVEKIKNKVLEGMGLIALHSAHHSKIMKQLLGTTMNLRWRLDDRERVWCVNPSHPIAEGLPEYFEIEQEEMYGEYFDIPTPDDVIFLGWFSGGEVIRGGCTFTRGRGKIFYFQPGHEEYPVYHQREIQKIITNAVRWAKPVNMSKVSMKCINMPPKPEDLRI